jgi:hypothetical protein
MLKGWGAGILLGVGAAVAAPIIFPAAGAVLRPLAKALIMGCLAAADAVQEVVAEAREQMGDLVAEAKAERGNGAATVTTRQPLQA